MYCTSPFATALTVNKAAIHHTGSIIVAHVPFTRSYGPSTRIVQYFGYVVIVCWLVWPNQSNIDNNKLRNVTSFEKCKISPLTALSLPKIVE